MYSNRYLQLGLMKEYKMIACALELQCYKHNYAYVFIAKCGLVNLVKTRLPHHYVMKYFTIAT